MKYFIALLISILPLASWAETYYISPTGTADWASCTSINTPCHVYTALDNAVAGDTMLFLDGTYPMTRRYDWNYRYPNWPIERSGTAENPIVFKSLNLHGAKLHSSVGHEGASIGSYLEDYIHWDGFELTASNADGSRSWANAQIYNGIGCAFKNLKIRGTYIPSTDNNTGMRLEKSQGLFVENNHIYDFTGDSHNVGALMTYDVDNSTIKNNLFENSTMGFYVKGYPHKTLIIENNWFKGNVEGVLETTGTIASNVHPTPHNEDIKVRHNLFTGQTSFNLALDGDESDTVKGERFIYNNNTIYGGVSGIYWYGASEGAGATIYNNIIHAVTGTSLRSSYAWAADPIASDHNLLTANTPVVALRSRYPGPVDDDYDTIAAWQASTELYGGASPGAGSITGDPLFVNASGTMAERNDFVLAANSPAKGSGRNGADMGADIANVGPSWMFARRLFRNVRVGEVEP